MEQPETHTPAQKKMLARLTSESWIALSKRVSVRLDGSVLVVSCRDTEEDPDDGEAEAVLRARGLLVRLSGNGDADGDQYVERIDDWRWIAPAHRPRQDPKAARVVKSYRLHPSTVAGLDREAKRSGESAGQVIDRLVAGL